MEQGSSYGFAVLKGENAELLEMFDAGLANLKASGKYDEIVNTYVVTGSADDTETEGTSAAETEGASAAETESAAAAE